LTVVIGFGFGFGAGTAGDALATVFDAGAGIGAGTGAGVEGTGLAFDVVFGSTRLDVALGFTDKGVGFGFNADGAAAALLDGLTSSSKKSSPDLRKEKKPAPPLLSDCLSPRLLAKHVDLVRSADRAPHLK
jgi:hypothetical protein